MADYDSRLVTLDDMLKVLETMGLGSNEAEENANYVMDMFGFDDRIIDNDIEPGTRQVLYILHEAGFLTTEREETTIYDGSEWRTHYWVLNKKKIFNASEQRREILKIEKEEDSGSRMYEDLPDDVWKHRNRD